MKNILLTLMLLSLWAISGAVKTQEVKPFVFGLASYQNDFVADCHNPNFDDKDWPKFSLRDISEFQHYCVRVPVTINSDSMDLNTKLLVMMLASADIYWDGVKIGDKGKPAINKNAEQPGAIQFSHPMSSEQLSKGKHLLSMKVSSYNHTEDMHSIFYIATLANGERLGHYQKINLIAPLLLIGAMLLLFVFFAFSYFFYQRDTALLIFSLLCLFSGALIAIEIVKYFYSYPWDLHIVRLKIMQLTTAITGLLLVCYYLLYYRFSQLKLWLGGTVLLIAGTIFLPFSYDAKSAMIFLIALLVAISINITAARNGLAQAKVNSLAKINALMLSIGLVVLLSLPQGFIDKWFAAVFSVIAIANLFNLTSRFGQQRKQAMLSLKLEAEMLRRNLQPHFLMNSLLLVVEWIETQPQLAVEFIEELADEFRLLNNLSQQSLVPLKQELELCRKHFSIMTMRYQRKLTLTITGEDIPVNLPPAILHTVIENAFSHNQIKDQDSFTIALMVRKQKLEISLQTPFRNRQHSGTGTGDSYIKTRLSEAYENNWKYQSYADGNSWHTELTLPVNTN